ncbi:hypothetical protein GJAV_G00106980 [Gymnothorax javanicus]|nr:hypothetical protein GJAV_G00106980 [Gymnothorax javanicus]
MAGKSFSMADVTVFPVVAYGIRFGVSPERYPVFAQYYTRLKEHPSIKATWPPHWVENPQGMDILKDV